MNDSLINLIHQANPWLKTLAAPIVTNDFIPRVQMDKLLLPEWDKLWLVLIGPGKRAKLLLQNMLLIRLLNNNALKI